MLKDDPATVAATLTRKEQQALLRAPRIGGNNPGREQISLCDLGLADCTIAGDDEAERWRLHLTDDGRAVRHELERNAP